MVINKNSWHYKVFAWTYRVWGSSWKIRNDKSDLCTYVQRLIWMPIPSALWWVLRSLLYIASIPFAFVFGGRPYNIWKGVDVDGPWRRYPAFKVWGEVQVYPWVIVVPLAFLFGEWEWFKHNALCAALVQGGLLSFFAAVFTIAWFEESGKSAIKEWVAAKKAGYCPTIVFQDNSKK